MNRTRPRISEAEAERQADAIVVRRLATDRAYCHAENAEAQSAREDEIARAVWADLDDRYIIGTEG
jgi:hypothetical protein